MGAMDAGGWAILGIWDNFDSANAVVEMVEEQVKAAIDEGRLQPELHPAVGDRPAHFHDPGAEMLAELQEARNLVNAARLKCQTVLEAL